MRLTKGDIIYQAVIYFVVTLLLLLAVFPLFYVVSSSFVSETEWTASGGKIIIPKQPVLDAYRTVLNEGTTFLRAFRVSVTRTLLGTSLTIFFTMCMGYVLSRRDIPFNKAILFMTLVTILFGGGLIPTFLVVNGTKIYNTIWALVIPGLVDSWAVLVFRQFFLNTPESIEESARIDGAGEITIMWVIVVPLSKAVIAALTLFTAVSHWNAWFDAAVYLKDASLKPFQLLMRDLFVNIAILTQRSSTGSAFDLSARITPNSVRMAITVLGTLPILCIYPFLQKYFTKGVYMGAVKE
ncbi:MAG: carbohydrate ABC transporter permease [Treponema sp.]|jgi:putative aldouronate transport system permease protein|nr:carbohydrate ABC transporter permease [Treponema sp.]